MAPEHDDDDDAALTPELRALLSPRAGRGLWLLVLLTLGLGVAALVASRTALATLWR